MNGFTYCKCGKCESWRRGMHTAARPASPSYQTRELWFAKHVETCDGCEQCVPRDWLPPLSNLPHGYHTVAWYEQFKHRGFVFMRRGTGETGWWHQHEGEADYGGNPMDYKRTMGAYECRTCGATLSQDAATKARASEVSKL